MMSPKNEEAKQKLLRKIPSVDRVLEHDDMAALLKEYPRGLVVKAIQKRLEKIRQTIVLHPDSVSHPEQVTTEDLEKEIADMITPNLKKVINATGVILHTNLGRSILPQEAQEHLVAISHSYSNLEYNLEKGERGLRYSHVEEVLRDITGAEAAFVVNNNAGAVLLTLNTLARGRETIVSRGELIEIGGSFRIPDIMQQSGSHMVEVGTTNKTHLHDYKNALSDRTALLLKVHTSNYRIVGFTTEVDLPELVALGKRHGLNVANDLGSGSLIDFSTYGLEHEPTVQEVLKTGVDVVTFSGDKLLGGPQAGIVVGKRKIIERLMKNPLTRALRIDKLTLAALESVLRLYLDQELAIGKIPTLRMITMKAVEIKYRAKALQERLLKMIPADVEIKTTEGVSQVGGGALPSQELPTTLLTLHSKSISVQELEKRLREYKPPIVTRIHKNQLCIDLRTVEKDDEKILESALVDIATKDAKK